MKVKRIIPYVIACFLLMLALVLAGSIGSQNHLTNTDKATADEATAIQEMRGVWVTFMTLDVEGEADKKTAFSRKIDAVITDMKEYDLNTMIVQVRPFCDALYRSRYYPWSHIISGTQGQDPGFDPLELICDKCRDAGISVHGWINPYRVSTAETPSALSEDNPYQKDNTIGMVVNGETYLNPADQRVRELIVCGVIELLENYDLDGIQFDDYFYPENGGDFDAADYAAYVESTTSPMSLEDYRKENVNILIRDVYRAVHSTKRSAVFGISPQGNLGNNEYLSADVVRWCKEEGYIDYICPQLYYSLDNPAQRYEDALKEWQEIEHHDGLRMIVGLGAYKAGTDADEGTWLDNDDILKTEVEILRRSNCDGFVLFSYDSLHAEEGQSEMKKLKGYLRAPTQ